MTARDLYDLHSIEIQWAGRTLVLDESHKLKRKAKRVKHLSMLMMGAIAMSRGAQLAQDESLALGPPPVRGASFLYGGGWGYDPQGGNLRVGTRARRKPTQQNPPYHGGPNNSSP